MLQGALSLEMALIVIASLLLLSVVASKASAKLGVPALLLFIGIGIAAGSEGPGGILFEDYALTQTIGVVALAFILFSAGLDTSWRAIKPIVWRGLSLATVGVASTALLVGLFAHFVLGFTMLEGLLLGAVVSSTDAAAIFGVLRSRGIALKHRLTPLLEFESGSNDPLAAFLTIGLTSLLLNPNDTLTNLALNFLRQMPLGAFVGFVAGLGAVWIINRLRLEYDGLYPVITLSAVCLIFGLARLVGGNEFLAVYVAGITMGNRNFLHRIALLQFHDGLAWLMQIVMFLVLGLLAFPSQIAKVMWSGLLLSLFLIFVARPMAVFLALPTRRRMPRRARLFIAWAGLRGAVPIIFATIPLLAGVPQAPTIFNLVFFIVITSVLIQGMSLRWVARGLGVIVEDGREVEDAKATDGANLVEVTVAPESPAVGRQVVELGLPNSSLLLLLKRDGGSYIPRGGTVLRAGDTLLVASRKEDREEIRQLLMGARFRTPAVSVEDGGPGVA